MTPHPHPRTPNSYGVQCVHDVPVASEAGATDVGIAMVVLLALSFIPSAFMVYLTNERISQERHMQSISGVGTTLYWFTSFLWDMVSPPLTLHTYRGVGGGGGRMEWG